MSFNFVAEVSFHSDFVAQELYLLYIFRALKREWILETTNNFIIANNPHLYFPAEKIVKIFNSG